MYGNFSEESIAKAAEILDYTRCKRPDGTYYGTAGNCKKGKLAGAKAAPSPKAPAEPAIASAPPKPPKPKTTKSKTPAAPPTATPSKPKTSKATEAKTASPKQTETPAAQLLKKYQALSRKHQELREAGKEDEAREVYSQAMQTFDAWKKASKGSPKSNAKLTASAEVNKRERDEWNATFAKINNRQEAVRSSLSPKDIAAIGDYTDEGGNRPYTKLNTCLRSPLCVDLKARAHAAQLDKALRKMPRNEDGDTFYRGVNVNSPSSEKLYEFLSKAKPGTKMKDPGFSSYSLDESVTAEFQGSGKNILFISRSKELRPINRFSQIPEEHEAILPRGTRSTIRSVKQEGNTLIVELD